MSASSLSIVLAGDLILDEPDPAHWLSGIAPALRAAGLAIGHLEVPHTSRGVEVAGDVPSPAAAPEHLAALKDAGFDMLSLAGNHMADCGAIGIADTIAGLDALGIAHAGAGSDLAASRAPAFASCGDRRVALLSYNCVGPEWGWAGTTNPGVAYLPLRAADGEPITPRSAIPTIDEAAFDILRDDIAATRQEADVVLVAMHKGRVHTPAILEPYERPLAHAAIEFGADAVVGHHAHIARGIEFHAGKPIFHGLGNGCVVTRALSPMQDHPARREWAERRKSLFGFEPEADYPLAPFHPEAKQAFLGRIDLQTDGNLRASVIPMWIEPPGRPVIATGERAAQVRRYLIDISARAALPPIVVGDDGQIEQAA